MAYPHSLGYDTFYKSDPPFHPPTSSELSWLHPTHYPIFYILPSHLVSSLSSLISSFRTVSFDRVFVRTRSINSTHFKNLRANLIHQNSNWGVEIILILHGTNHILILNSIGLPWIHHPHNLNSIAIMRTRNQHERKLLKISCNLHNKCSVTMFNIWPA